MFIPRRAHKKSRMGCFECKRRRRKCDELRPSCTRCEMTFQECSYPALSVSPAPTETRDTLSLPSPPCSHSSGSPDGLTSLGSSPSCETYDSSNPTLVEATSYTDVSGDSAVRLSDADLYQHYLEHTSHTLTQFPGDQSTFQTAIPALALRSKMVLDSLKALSAICICCDMIDKGSSPSIDAVNHILMTGYRLCNLASEQMRELIAQPYTQPAEIELLLSSVVLLVPFAAASQQVSHWISSQSTTQKSHRFLSSTPRDVIVMMRGIRATVQALQLHEPSAPLETGLGINTSSRLLGVNGSPALPLSRTHVMFPIVAATSHAALSKLGERLKSTLDSALDKERNQGLACAAAFDILADIETETLSPSDPSAQRSSELTTEEVQTRSWLRCYASSHAILKPTEPLTYLFLTFLVRVPQAYLDLVLPLLDQRLESPLASIKKISLAPLTKEQALALDIYAHWSVLMILVEEESWWIGKLPIVTLKGMVNRYSDDFVDRLWPRERYSKGKWWPGSMLKILCEIKGCV